MEKVVEIATQLLNPLALTVPAELVNIVSDQVATTEVNFSKLKIFY